MLPLDESGTSLGGTYGFENPFAFPVEKTHSLESPPVETPGEVIPHSEPL